MARKRRMVRRSARRRGNASVARERAMKVPQLMREGHSFAQAARRAKTTPRTVLKYARSAFRKSPSGRWAVRPSDRLTRDIRIMTKDGIAEVRVRGSRPASRNARYFAAVQHYFRTGDTKPLAEFRGQSIRAGGDTYPFITDVATLERLDAAGETTFEQMYTLRG